MEDKEIINKSIILPIKIKMLEKGINQTKLAELTNSTNLSYFFQGNVNGKTLIKILEVLELKIEIIKK
jgi:hypothetical protein